MAAVKKNGRTQASFLFLTLVLQPGFTGSALSASTSWEMVRTLGSSAGQIEVSSDSIRTACSIGEPLTGYGSWSSGTITSGYLSQIPSNILAPAVTGVQSSGSITNQEVLMSTSGTASLKLFFTNDMATASVKSEIKVVELFDNSGNEKNRLWSYGVDYSPQEKAGIISPSADWPKGSLFAVHVTTGIKDENGVSAPTDTTYYFTLIMDHTKDNVAPVLHDFKTLVRVPANTYGEDFFMTISTAQNQEIVKAANSKIISSLGADRAPFKVLSATRYSSEGKTLALAAPSLNATVALSYKDDNGDGVIDGTNPQVKTKNLSIWRLDESRKLWIRLPGARIDPVSRQVSLDINNLSAYALISPFDTDVTNVYAYPVPFRPNAGNPTRYGTWQDGIRFTNMPSEGRIKIYTISLDLVRELDVVPPETVWDVKNYSGETVASGIYIWEIVSGDNRKTGKLAVVK